MYIYIYIYSKLAIPPDPIRNRGAPASWKWRALTSIQIFSYKLV